MKKKRFNFKKGRNKIKITIDYRKPTKKEVLCVGAVASLIVSAVILFNVFSSKDD